MSTHDISASSFSQLITEKINTVTKNTELGDDNKPMMVQSIFNTTSCYDLMQASSKAVVFEVPIPFQLAFYAMVENETEVAPLWDPERRVFVGLLTIYDYINALRICLHRNIPMIDLSSKTIADILASPFVTFHHPYFDPLEPDDSIYQLCKLLYNSKSDYAPIIDPETGNLVTVLGYLDIVHLVDCAAKQYPAIFSETLDSLQLIGHDAPLTIKRSALVHEVLTLFENKHITGAPVVDDTGKVINFYHKADVTFIVKASDPDAILTNLRDYSIGDILILRDQLIASGEMLVTTQGLVTCSSSDPINAVLNAMMIYRVTKVVVVDINFFCIGIVSIKDILAHYLANGALP